ncbi:MAG: fumarate reductase subunit C [Betaproteobacteria bacterium]|nr:fumarate reductase subunit C [Betaproteobacteria bacterium]
MSARRPYVRSMDGWWRRDPFFVGYMAREATAVLVVAYAVVLLIGLIRLSQGQAAYEGWLYALRSPLAIGFHIVLLAVFMYHTWSWFRIMPKTMPLILPDGRRLSPALITGAGLTAAAIVCASLVVAAMKVAA